MKLNKLILANALLSAMSAPAFAEMYAFGDVGSVAISNGGSLSNPTAFRGGIGWGDNEIIKSELSYLMTSDASYSSTTGNIAMSSSSLAYGIVGSVPMQSVSGLSFTGRLGLALNSVKATASGAYAALDGMSATTMQLQWGIGAAYAINKQVSVRASFESLGKFKAESTASGADFTMLSAGVNYSF